MKKHKVLITVTILMVIVIGSVPGFITLLIDTPGPFQRPDGPYWKALVTGIPSILAGILIGYFISKVLLRIWFKIAKSIIFKSIIILFITYIAGLITLGVACEVDWIVPAFLGWENTPTFLTDLSSWENLIDHFLLAFLYFSIPAVIAGVLNGLFSFIYLKFSK